MRKLMVFRFLWIGIIFALTKGVDAERFEYLAPVNLPIPTADSTGVHDTIFIPLHINMEDINFYIAINSEPEGWADEVMIDVISSQRIPVTLNGWHGPTFGWYYVWYDTDREEDGPGELENYSGVDAFGEWEMFCFNPFDNHDFTWYYWRIEVYGELITGIEENGTDALIPKDYLLKEAFPNPFNSTTIIEFGLPVESRVKIEIYDILGRLCKTLIDSEMPAGYHQVQWNGEDEADRPVVSGVYLVKMTSGDRQFTNRAVLVK